MFATLLNILPNMSAFLDKKGVNTCLKLLMKSQFLEKTVSLLLRILTVRALLVNLEETHVELIEIVSFISTINFIEV